MAITLYEGERKWKIFESPDGPWWCRDALAQAGHGGEDDVPGGADAGTKSDVVLRSSPPPSGALRPSSPPAGVSASGRVVGFGRGVPAPMSAHSPHGHPPVRGPCGPSPAPPMTVIPYPEPCASARGIVAPPGSWESYDRVDRCNATPLCIAHILANHTSR